MTYLNQVYGEPTPQSEPIPAREHEMVENEAGGFVFEVNDLDRLRRFMVLGSEGGSYYASERKLTLENAKNIRRCIDIRGPYAVDAIREMIASRRAPKMGPPLFALAMAASFGTDSVRAEALNLVPSLVNTATHLFQFVDYVDSMRGWGPGLRRAITEWYMKWPQVEDVAYQIIKYRSRHGWTHRDLLRKSHPVVTGEMNDLFGWVTQGTELPDTEAFRMVHAYEQAKTATTDELVELIQKHNLSWEMVPAEKMGEDEVWRALFERMPMMALVRNLGNLTARNIIKPLSDEATRTVERINRLEGQLHPISVLSALLTYKNGRGARGSNTWSPVQPVTDALDRAFERSFNFAPQTNKRFYLALDVSGSMTWGEIAGVPGLTPRDGAAAMAVAIARREPNYHIAAFASGSRGSGLYGRRADMIPVNISASTTFADAVKETDALMMGGTDCALPMLDATEKQLPVDCFVVLTDSETWAGRIHPIQALKDYRKKMGIPAKLVVVAMTSNGFTIADPDDAGMLDVVGFDSAAPQLIADFAAKE